MQIEDSDNEDEDKGMDHDAIANELFDGDDVSILFNFLNECFSTAAFFSSQTIEQQKNNPTIFLHFCFFHFFHVAIIMCVCVCVICVINHFGSGLM